jgi:hypothetical protein
MTADSAPTPDLQAAALLAVLGLEFSLIMQNQLYNILDESMSPL